MRGADLVVDHGNGLLGARVVWPDNAVEVITDGPHTRLTAQGHDTTGDLGVMLEIRTCSHHDVVIKQVTLTNTGHTVLSLSRPSARHGNSRSDPARSCTSWPGVGPGIHGLSDLLASRRAVHRQPPRHHLPSLRPGAVPGLPSRTRWPGIRDRVAWSGSWRLLIDAFPSGIGSEWPAASTTSRPSFDSSQERRSRHRPPWRVRARRTQRPRRRWHHYQRNWLARDLDVTRRSIVYNSWYATRFDVQRDHQLALADRAAELGAETFVVDDGWFAGRTGDRTGLGNWWPDPVKFPDGLDPLITGVLARGLRFGIWVEPEAISPEADILAEHPDWIYRAGDRPLVTVRNQYVLDFGRRAVLEWTEHCCAAC